MMKRHLARMANTDQRIVVVYMQIPERETHALVVATDNLPPRWEQHLMTVVESAEGQADPDLANVLARRLMPDTTDTLLTALHKAGLLRPVPISSVIMFPEPNRPYSLEALLKAMGRVIPDEFEILNEQEAVKEAEQKFNPHVANQEAASHDGQWAIANGLLIEADLLEADAKAKRERAYTFAPGLRPKVPTKRVAAPVAEVATPVKKTRRVAAKTPVKPTRKPRAKAS